MEWTTPVLNANPHVDQLLDANLDRAREGLRVIEDWCRYGLSRKDLVITLKDWRQQLGQQHLERYKKARCTESDQGIGLTHPAQKSRDSPEKVIAANCSRVQEALRVLEEFARSSNPDLAKTASSIRYELYDFESNILYATKATRLHERLEKCNLCLVTSPHNALRIVVKKALEAGIGMIQYRSKNITDSNKISEASELALLCKEYESLFIINDRLDIALAVNADGVHLGQEDLPIKIARNILGPGKIIGQSTHSIKEIKEAQYEGCDYLGVGPVYPTRTKPELNPAGTNIVSLASQIVRLPWFAIGGISSSNLDAVLYSGAKKIAVSGAIMQAKDPSLATSSLMERLS